MTTETRAERRRAARAAEKELPLGEADELPEEAGPVPYTADEIAAMVEGATDMPEEPEQVPTMADQILTFGQVVKDLKMPVGNAVKLIEVILMYDVNRRSLQIQEATMGGGFGPNGMPPGARAVTPEELAAMTDEANTEPLEPEEE